jgi:two-component system, NarL family, sensor histidine kinase DesK
VAAAVVVAIAFPLLHVAYIFVMPEGGYKRGMWALAAVAAYLPLHVRHVWFAVRATRPPGGIWMMAAMAAIIIGAVPLAGSAWVMEFSWLAVSVLIDLPRAFRTADLWLIHAADCCSRYSSWTCCGVRY